MSMLIGLIDGDGYISITKTPNNYIRLGLIISLHPRDIELLEYGPRSGPAAKAAIKSIIWRPWRRPRERPNRKN